MFVYCCNNPAFAADHEGLSAQSIEIGDWGSEGCWSGMSDEEATYLFDCCYWNTYGGPYTYTYSSAQHLTVSYYVSGRTDAERTADVGALGGVGYFVGKFASKVALKLIPGYRWASLLEDVVGLATAISFAIASDRIVKDTNEKKIFRVDEWGVYNGERRGVLKEYEVNDEGYLTLIYRAYYIPNPYYNTDWAWDANGNHWS